MEVSVVVGENGTKYGDWRLVGLLGTDEIEFRES